jgi:hypothetical protein
MKGLEVVRRVSAVLWVAALLLVVGCASGGAGSAPAPPPPPAAVGSWNLVVETPVGNQESVLTVSGTAEMLEGMLSGEQGETPLTSVVYAGEELTFAISIDAQGQQLDLTFKGTVSGDSLSGSFESPFGPIPVTGTRAGG